MISELQEAASEGPVIVTNKSCTSLNAVVISSWAQRMHMQLGPLTPEDLAKLKIFFWEQ